MKKKHSIIIASIFLSFILLLCTTGCSQKISAEKRISDMQNHMNEIKNYLAEVSLIYSDEEQNINATFVSYIEVENEKDSFNGMLNYNGENFETSGTREKNQIVIQNLDKQPVLLPNEIPRITDLKITNVKEVVDRAGNENLTYFLVTLNDEYNAKLGIGDDNILYSISIDLRDKSSAKLVSVYRVDVEIKDEIRPIETINFSPNTIIKGKSFFDLFIQTDRVSIGSTDKEVAQ